MTDTDRSLDPSSLPRWNVSDVYPSLTDRQFVDAVEHIESGVERLTALFDHHHVRATARRDVTAADGAAADELIAALNAHSAHTDIVDAYVYSFISTNSHDDIAQGLGSQIDVSNARIRPLMARLAEWIRSLGVDDLAAVSEQVAAHVGPLRRLAYRAEHQMSEAEERLYADLLSSGSSAWARLHSDVTSQLEAHVSMPEGHVSVLPMAAVRGMATSPDPATRKAAYDAELDAWPRVTVACAAAMNGVKGEANVVNARRQWDTPLSASLFANSVSREIFDAMHTAVVDALPDFRRWMRAKAVLHGHASGLPWYDLVAPSPTVDTAVSWDDGLDIVRNAFRAYSTPLGGLVDRAVNEEWLDAEPRTGKTGGAFCMPFVGDRSLVFLNWTGGMTSTQTAAHELGHAYHNTQLAHRTPLQRNLPMALAETASIFCETLVTESNLGAATDSQRLALLDTDLVGANQIVVDIHSRFLFETEVFARRQRRTLSPTELSDMMLEAQRAAYGDGIDVDTLHPYMWAVKPHYYGSHFYNWPYTYGLLFGLGLYAAYRKDPERFQATYDDVLSRAGMDDAATLGEAFGFDVSSEDFWVASLDVLRARIDDYQRLVDDRRSTHPARP